VNVGILGGGQLGRMLALAGYPLGLRFTVFDPDERACAGQVARVIAAAYDDWDALAHFAEAVDVVTYEFENVPVETAAFVATRAPIHPPLRALEAAQDRLREKELFRHYGLETVAYAPVGSREETDAASGGLTFPCVLKTRRLGYDGKGQMVVATPGGLASAWMELGSAPCIAEEWASYTRELSLIAVRDERGTVAFYPWVENEHRHGILRVSKAPANPTDSRAGSDVRARIRELMADLGYVGVLAVEFFEVDGRLLANEMAPRVHNSGHWTIDGAWTSQFENHVRAVCGMPLGDPGAREFAGMVNMIGAVPPISHLLSLSRAKSHLYGKEARPGRKLGHVNVAAETPEERDALVAMVRAVIEGHGG
jgi:5-(carboxyamino)imidazole ribonucleotide synthase